jgi:hypothetical protein
MMSVRVGVAATLRRVSTADCWDPQRWQPRAVRRRCRRWIAAMPWRRRIFWIAVLLAGLLAIPAVVGAIAVATAGPAHSEVLAPNGGVSWTGVRDSYGVPVADYQFLTNNGSVLHPVNTALALVLYLEDAGFMIIVTTAIWIVGYAISFDWLDLLSRPLTEVGKSLTNQIATPIVLTVAGTIGAAFVGWFTVRGYYAKAAAQVFTMVAVALAGVTYLAQPLADVLSPNGILMDARNVGISVAAGVNGNSSPDPSALVNTLQGTLTTNFMRHPLQLWDFGTVLDTQGTCGGAWTSGVESLSADQLDANIKSCLPAAEAYAQSPSVAQLGTGLAILLFGTILLAFGVYLGGKIFITGLESIYHAIAAIFGFAAGGFIYGPTQAFLIRNLVDSVTSAFLMMTYTIYLGVYALLLNDLFAQF